MLDTSKSEIVCIENYDCGNGLNRISSIFFFVSFIIIAQYVMLNLFILILVQELEVNYLNKDNPLHDFKNIEANFKETWLTYSIEKAEMIPERRLADFILHLPKPLGHGKISLQKEKIKKKIFFKIKYIQK
jgi:hypothetical protein